MSSKLCYTLSEMPTYDKNMFKCHIDLSLYKNYMTKVIETKDFDFEVLTSINIPDKIESSIPRDYLYPFVCFLHDAYSVNIKTDVHDDSFYNLVQEITGREFTPPERIITLPDDSMTYSDIIDNIYAHTFKILGISICTVFLYDMCKAIN